MELSGEIKREIFPAVRESASRIIAERHRLATAMQAMGIQCYPSEHRKKILCFSKFSAVPSMTGLPEIAIPQRILTSAVILPVHSVGPGKRARMFETVLFFEVNRKESNAGFASDFLSNGENHPSRLVGADGQSGCEHTDSQSGGQQGGFSQPELKAKRTPVSSLRLVPIRTYRIKPFAPIVSSGQKGDSLPCQIPAGFLPAKGMFIRWKYVRVIEKSRQIVIRCQEPDRMRAAGSAADVQ